ncbi:ribosome small subunit-dependent GTPase A [Candidatus Methylospira mobilis]|uniref:Small ribosomal subunit biogenesis GTPase RsgA n=1 Tax=Candidatus Methylospira mobilis TaxID=1808979 RepID=A0A5Q0BKY6_9GAMM|nr:ribosome small subunit-dependent GTPase A [Candidatus Methylospira mobilis]QFY44450.1 ribosome small subunit-dependent GTPase A [Candidatus Methylospira mobilis]WNV06123.1 ribosome small subunit-dependent GTPase A [Candidatus Methylospira mobilis]
MSAERDGLVIAHLGKGVAVEGANGAIVLCHTRRRLGDVTVGDRVRWVACDGDLGRVESVLPRTSCLLRPGYAGKLRYVAANLDRIYVVLAPLPEPDWLLVDQFLAVTEARDIDARLLVNKADLTATAGSDGISARLREYEMAGYTVRAVSALQRTGMDALMSELQGQCSMFVGQSGVGKSSLTNTLLPERDLRIGEISEKSGLGRHTTTTATLYHLPGGGDLIDSPGVAVFGLAEMNWNQLAWSYREFQSLIPNCRFNDCRHAGDKGCAIMDAVNRDKVSAARYQRFLKLGEKLSSQMSGV